MALQHQLMMSSNLGINYLRIIEHSAGIVFLPQGKSKPPIEKQ
jgi:hypothetical protein